MTVQTETIAYEGDGITFRGLLAWDDATTGPRPGVLIAHEAPGLADHPRRRAHMLAELGYAAFALDMYGEGKVVMGPGTLEQMKTVTSVPGLIRRRAVLGYEAMRRLPQVDTTRLGAIGYCFGGRTVIELARSGADLRGVVSFHGQLEAGSLEDDRAIRAKLLVCTGAEDPMVPVEHVVAFQQGLRAADVDWQVITYGRARHAFTNRDADPAVNPALAYQPQADQRSWTAMRAFFDEVLA
jgi:dienelactone hydrolase